MEEKNFYDLAMSERADQEKIRFVEAQIASTRPRTFTYLNSYPQMAQRIWSNKRIVSKLFNTYPTSLDQIEVNPEVEISKLLSEEQQIRSSQPIRVCTTL